MNHPDDADAAEFASGRRSMARTVTLRLEQDAYDELREAATAEWRPLSNFIVTAALERVREAQFVDDGEMAEIPNDDALVRRLRTGSQQARRGKGDFVATSPTREQSPALRRRDGFRDRRAERD